MLAIVDMAGWTKGKQGNQKIVIKNGFFAVYIVYILWIIGIEWINFVFSLVGIRISPFGTGEIISLLLIVLLLLISKKHIVIESISLSTEFWIGIILILIYGCLTSVYPDRGWDTFNYHIIAQSPQFRNYFEDTYFGYGLFQVWGFRLGDRCFYYLRLLLGYRMGTILNTLVLIIAYTQICQLLDQITKQNRNILLRICCNKLIWAMAILFDKQAILMFASYYVDVLAIPIGLEIFRVLKNGIKSETNLGEIIYFALLNGIWLGFKITNIIYVFPCILIFLFLHIRKFNVKSWVAAISVGLYPFIVYLMYAFLYTGNPVFPYYNTIFKSPFYPIINFKDGRWGGTTIGEKLVWILYAALKPGYRQNELFENIPSAILLIGIIGFIVIIAYMIIHRIMCKKKEINVLLTLALMSSFLWAFTTGYSRYFIFGKILWGLIGYFFIIALYKKFRIWGKLFSSVASVMVVICLGINIHASFSLGINWSWNVWRIETFNEELKYVFKDRVLNSNPVSSVDLFVLLDQASQGIAELFDPEVKVINASYAGLAEKEYQQALKNQLSITQKVADIHIRSFGNIAEYIDTLNANGFIATSFEDMNTHLGDYEVVYLEPAENAAENSCWILGDNSYEIPLGEDRENVNFSFIAGRTYALVGAYPITLKIFAVNNSAEREISTILVDNISINNFNIPLDLAEGDTHLIIRAYQANGQLVSEEEPYKVFILNANVN